MAAMERGWPFTREFGATGVNGIALLTEYGIIVSLTALAHQVVTVLRGSESSRRH